MSQILTFICSLGGHFVFFNHFRLKAKIKKLCPKIFKNEATLNQSYLNDTRSIHGQETAAVFRFGADNFLLLTIQVSC